MKINNRATYLSEIIISLEILNGMGSLKEINDVIEKRNAIESIHTNINWRDNVRAVIQRHCSQTLSYHGGDDLFYSVYGLGEGYWGLNTHRNQSKYLPISPIEQRQVDNVLQDKNLTVTEKESIIISRVGQGDFRRKILNKYGSCVITGISNKKILIASHIKPWRSANNAERLSENNGLLLSPLFDKLFDLGLMTFQKNGKVIFSNQLSSEDRAIVSVNENKIFLTGINTELKTNLEYHNDVVFLK